MNTQDLVKRHQDAIKLLEAIEYFEKERHECRYSIVFVDVATCTLDYHNHRIDICTRCIKRLTERYNRLYNSPINN